MLEPSPRCQVCGEEIGFLGRVGQRDTCTHCGADLHACRQCAFYDPQASNQCREPDAERIRYKDEANHCDLFQPSKHIGAQLPREDPAAEAKRKLEALFKK